MVNIARYGAPRRQVPPPPAVRFLLVFYSQASGRPRVRAPLCALCARGEGAPARERRVIAAERVRAVYSRGFSSWVQLSFL